MLMSLLGAVSGLVRIATIPGRAILASGLLQKAAGLVIKHGAKPAPEPAVVAPVAPIPVPTPAPNLEAPLLNAILVTVGKKFLSSLGKGVLATLAGVAIQALGILKDTPLQSTDPASVYVYGAVIGNLCHAAISAIQKWRDQHVAVKAVKA